MKQLTCEMCGGTDLVKDGGVFVCQTCGCKYSIEEAKRMMIEGTVDVQGTVKVDNTAFVEKYLANARRAKEKEDWEETEKYYNMVEQNDSSNIEAIFNSAYAKARLTLSSSDFFKRGLNCEVFCNSISVIDDNYDVEKSEENQKLIIQMNADLFVMYKTYYNRSGEELADDKGYFPAQGTRRRSVKYLFGKIALSFIESLENIIKVDDQIIYWKIIYEQRKYLAESKNIFNKELRIENWQKATEVGQKIHEMDSSFEIETIEEPKGGCYVATAVYGSYDCHQVWTLRRYRDDTLASTWYGRAFIYTYYAISPTLVKWFGDTNWFKNMWKGKLDRMVANLQAEGVEDTPYEDKDWRK